MKQIKRHQQGLTIPTVLGIMAVLTILAIAFLGMVRFQIQRTGFEQSTITAAYVAEMGFQQVRAELASVGGDWTKLGNSTFTGQGGTNIVSDCATSNPKYPRCQRIPDTSSFADYRIVHENPLDNTSRIIGIYEVAIETGQKRAIFNNKTLTGSAKGFVPGSANANEQIGYDVYGNELCDQTSADQTCPGGFLGVKIKGWLTDPKGNIMPKSRAQTVYGVLQLDSRSLNDEGPSGYMLESDANILVESATDWDSTANDYVTLGGFYGPMHTNEQYEFQWESLATDTVNKGTHDGTDFLPTHRPFWGLLMTDIGVQWNLAAPRLYTSGTDLTFTPFGKFWAIDWSPPAGNEPSPGTNYTVTFQKSDGTTQSVSMTKGAANTKDFAPNPFNVPFEFSLVSQVRQGATIYTYSNDFNLSSDHVITWQVFDPNTGNWISNGAGEPVQNADYRARYISHSPIRVYDNMTYSGSAPLYRYWHTHAMDSNWPYYQAAHGHTDVVGADFSVNSVSGDPGYDGTTWRHSHYITTDLSSATIGGYPNTYLQYNSPSFIPSSTGRHEPPLLMPNSDINNYKNQMEQLNHYLELTLGVVLPRDVSGTLDASQLANAPFNASDYAKGYLVGKFPSNVASYSASVVPKLPASLQGDPPLVDFRAVYFGNDLKYSAGGSAGSEVIASGSPFSDTAWIWVNDNEASSGYMKVASSRLDGNYRRYLYRQIPPSKVLLVRDAVVLIGNFDPQSGNCASTYHASCLDYHNGYPADLPGKATIVDGQLTILSFTTAPIPANQEHKYNKGDIVIVGNVIYHNDFFPLPSDKTQMRQLASQPESPTYTRSNQVNGPISNINDGAVEWVTDTTGFRHRDGNGNPVGSLDGLGLFATNDIKLSITPYFSPSGGADYYADKMRIDGELIAGRQVWVHGDDQSTGIPYSGPEYLPDGSYFSDIDRLEVFGTIYSRETPNFSEYFRVRREYFFDRSLQKNPLVGAPYYPQTAGDYRNQAIFSVFPTLVQGTWTQGLN